MEAFASTALQSALLGFLNLKEYAALSSCSKAMRGVFSEPAAPIGTATLTLPNLGKSPSSRDLTLTYAADLLTLGRQLQNAKSLKWTRALTLKVDTTTAETEFLRHSLFPETADVADLLASLDLTQLSALDSLALFMGSEQEEFFLHHGIVGPSCKSIEVNCLNSALRAFLDRHPQVKSVKTRSISNVPFSLKIASSMSLEDSVGVNADFLPVLLRSGNRIELCDKSFYQRMLRRVIDEVQHDWANAECKSFSFNGHVVSHSEKIYNSIDRKLT